MSTSPPAGALPADPAPRRARVVTYGLLAAIAACTIGDLEPWPLSSFRLFSGVRTERSVSFQVVTVDADGDESVLRIGELPRGYHSVGHLLPDLAGMDASERAELLGTLADGARDGGADVDAVRVYRVVRLVPTGDEPAAVVERTLRWELDEP